MDDEVVKRLKELGFKSLDDLYKEKGIDKTAADFLAEVEEETEKYFRLIKKGFEKFRKKYSSRKYWTRVRHIISS